MHEPDNTFLYVIGVSETGPVKIGYSKFPEKRVKQLQTGQAEKLKLFYSEAVTPSEARRIEKQIHDTNRYLRTRGEWFNIPVKEAIEEVNFGLRSDSEI